MTGRKIVQGKDVRFYLIGSIILLFYGILALWLGFFLGSVLDVREIYLYGMLILSFMLIILQCISIIAYFICPEITYGMMRNLRKTKNEKNKLIRLGRNIQIGMIVFLIIVMAVIITSNIITLLFR